MLEKPFFEGNKAIFVKLRVFEQLKKKEFPYFCIKIQEEVYNRSLKMTEYALFSETLMLFGKGITMW